MQEGVQFREIPITVVEVLKIAAFGLFARYTEGLIEETVSRFHPELAVHHDQRLLHGFDNRFRQLVRGAGLLKTALQCIDFEQRHHEAVNPVVRSPVRANSHQVPGAVNIPDFAFFGLKAADAIYEHLIQIGDVDIRIQIAHGPPDIGWNQVEHLLRHWREPADAQILAEHDYRNIHAAEQINQIVIELCELDIPGLKF